MAKNKNDEIYKIQKRQLCVGWLSLLIASILLIITIINIPPKPDIQINCTYDSSVINKIYLTSITITNKGEAPANNFVLKIKNMDIKEITSQSYHATSPSSVIFNYEYDTICRYKIYRGKIIKPIAKEMNVLSIDNNETNFYFECDYIPPKSQIVVSLDMYFSDLNISYWANNYKSIDTQSICLN